MSIGSRANYAIIRDSGAELHYSNWGGQHIEGDLLWGAEIAIPFIESLNSGKSEEILLDTTWCEGGAVVDLLRKRFLVFGGETIGRDPLLRNIWLRLAQISWAGWQASWAYHGIADMADALGIPREKVLGKLSSASFDGTKLYACHTPGGARMLLSIRNDDDSIKHFGFDAPVEYYFTGGETLINSLDRCKPYAVQEIAAGQNLPEDAIFIDSKTRRLVVTIAPVFGNYDPRLDGLIAAGWPGWTVELNYEGMRQHPAICDLDFRIPERPFKQMLAELRATVCRYFPASNFAFESRGPHSDPTRATPIHEVAKPIDQVVPLSEKERKIRFDKLVAKLES